MDLIWNLKIFLTNLKISNNNNQNKCILVPFKWKHYFRSSKYFFTIEINIIKCSFVFCCGSNCTGPMRTKRWENAAGPPRSPPTYTHAHPPTNTLTDAHKHSLTHTYSQTHTKTHTHTRAHPHTRAHTHTHTRTHTHWLLPSTTTSAPTKAMPKRTVCGRWTCTWTVPGESIKSF